MEATTRDLLFGTGRSGDQLRGTFAPRGWGGASPEKGEILSTFKGFGRDGKGREAGLKLMERIGLISSEQRAAGGSVASAAGGAGETGRVLGLVDDAAATGAAAGAANLAPRYANPVYGGLYAQTLMAQTGFVPPVEPPAGMAIATDAAQALPVDAAPIAAATDDAAATIASAADDVVDDVVRLEQRLLSSFERLARLPAESKVPALAKAVDVTAAAGHGGDAFDVLAQSLASRPLGDAADALDGVVDDMLRAAPVVDDAAKVATPLADEVAKVVAPAADELAKVAAPLADDLVAKVVPQVVEAAVPKLVEAALPKVVEAATPLLSSSTPIRTLVSSGGDDALRGVMSFSAGIDDTLRLLAKF